MRLNKKMKKRIISTVAAVLGMTLTMSSGMVANAESTTVYRLSIPYQYRTTLTTSYTPEHTKPVSGTQARHRKGTETSIGVSKNKSISEQASVNLTTGYSEVIVAERTLGLAETETHEVSSSVTYTLKNQPSGLYRIEVVYPGKKVTRVTERQCIHQKDKSKWDFESQATSYYTPRRGYSYHQCVRYSS